MKRVTLAVLLLVLLASALSVSVAAAAGSYEVSACNYAPGAVNNSWVWSTNDPSMTSHYAPHSSCPDRIGGNGGKNDQEGGLSTTDALGLSNGAPPGTSAAWIFKAAKGTTITGFKAERYIGHELDPFNDWSPALRADDSILARESCLDTVQNGESCFVGGPPGEGGEIAEITGLSADEISLGIECQAPEGEECVTGATKYAAWAAMYGASVTVSDSTPPTLSTPSGALWGPGEADGFHTGTESVDSSAEDIGGGVQSIILAADGQPIQTYTATCDFTYIQPCPSSTGPQTLSFSTTQLTDGTHTLTLTAVDASGNKSVVASHQITVDNDPPPAPIQLTATPIQPGSNTFTVTWQNPVGQVAPITSATYQLCPSTGACTTPAPAPPSGPATLTIPSAGTWTLKIWLTNAAGYSSPNNAATTTITTTTSSGNTGLNTPTKTGTTNTNESPDTSEDSTSLPTIPTTRLHITKRLHNRLLIIHITGPATGKVRVTYIGLRRHKAIVHGTKTASLKKGQLILAFQLAARAIAHTEIVVKAQFIEAHHSHRDLRVLPGHPARRRREICTGLSACPLTEENQVQGKQMPAAALSFLTGSDLHDGHKKQEH